MFEAYVWYMGSLNGSKKSLLKNSGVQFISIFILAASLIFALALPAGALTFTVDSLSDASNAVTDGSCNTIDGCTLREAIDEIEAGSDFSNTIDFDSSLSGTIQLQNILPYITKNLSISGPGSDVIGVDGQGLYQLFALLDDSVARNFDIQGLALMRGFADAGNGGAISIGTNKSLFVSDVVFSGNTANGYGGAIYSGPTSLVEISRCRLSGNNSAVSGGAVAAQGSILIDKALFVDNNAANGAALYIGGSAPSADIARSAFENNIASTQGGAIYASLGDAGLFHIVNSAIVGNTAMTGGGGMSVRGPGGRVIIREVSISNNFTGGTGGGVLVSHTPSSFVIVNSTISGNRADESGGGMANAPFPLQLSNSTIVGNVADADANGTGTGGGIYGGSGIILENTVIAGNSDLNAVSGHPDCSALPTSRGYNFIGDGSGCSMTAGTGDQIGAGSALNPLVEALAWNGGPTRTMRPIYNGSSGSPLVEAGNPAGCTYDDNGDGNSTQALTTDQRGLPRPYDADGLGGARCDIGAVEWSHCDDGIMDNDEEGIDCGGSCAACSCPSADFAETNGTTYASIQGAYDETWDGAEIRAREEDTGEALIFDRPAYITLIGGHDCDFFRIRGVTTVASLTVSAGRLTIENIAVGGP